MVAIFKRTQALARHKRYYLGEHDTEGVTPSQLARLGKKKQLAYMQAWFDNYFEDPVQRTSWYKYESIYRWGGPYDASRELEHEFGSGIDLARIQELVKNLESNGITEWAPTTRLPRGHYPIGGGYDLGDEVDPVGDEDVSEPPDFNAIIKDIQNGRIARFGNVSEQQSRKELNDYIIALEEYIRQSGHVDRGIGDNFPPPDNDEDATDASQVSVVKSAVKELQQEIQKVEPDILQTARAGLQLSKVNVWLKERLSKGSEKWVEGLIIAIPGLVTNEHLWRLIHDTTVALGNWLSVVLKIL